jgi:hypothetical protein
MSDSFHAANQKLSTIIAITNNKDVTLDVLIKEGNLLGWYYLGTSKAFKTVHHYLFMKMTENKPILQNEYTAGKTLSWPPKITRVEKM